MASKYIPEKGVTLDFPGMTDEQMNQILNSGQYDDYVKGLPAAPSQAGPPAGAPPPEGSAPAFPIAAPPGSTGTPSEYQLPPQAPPGIAREANIALRNIGTGAMDVAGLPGDIWALGNRLSGGIIPEGPSWLPTSAGVDRFATNIGLLDPRFTPSGLWENALAIGSRGVGGAAVMGGGPAALGRAFEYGGARLAGSTIGGQLSAAGAAMPVTPTLAQGGRIALSGAGGAIAADQTRQGMMAMGYDPSRDPLGLGTLLPLAAGGVVGAGLGGAADPYLGATPYQRALKTLGTSKAEIASKPLLADAGDSLKSALRSPGTLNPLSRMQTNALVGPKGQFAGESVAANAMNPQIAPQLIREFPDEMNDIATSTIANGRWPTLNDHTKEALLPNDQERAAIEAIHGGKSIVPEHGIPLFVSLEALGGLAGGAAAHVMHYDPMLGTLMGMAGSTLPFVPTVARAYSRFARTSPGTISGAGIGTGVSMPTTSNMSLAAPSTFAPPDQGGPVGQRTDQGQ